MSCGDGVVHRRGNPKRGQTLTEGKKSRLKWVLPQCSADVEPVVEELQQAFVRISEFLGSLRSKVMGRAPAFASQGSAAEISLSNLVQQAQPIFLLAEGSEGQGQPSFTVEEGDGIAMPEKVFLVPSSGADGLVVPDFELPTASQVPLR